MVAGHAISADLRACWPDGDHPLKGAELVVLA